jgi:hypothetical protein
MDGITPLLLQKAGETILPALTKIFRASYAWGILPETWTRVRVVYIPKQGNRDKTDPKSYRPISLTSFLLKAMEKVLNYHIREGALQRMPLHTKQHAYQKGKSTETALLDLVNNLGKALEDKEVALGAFLDVVGAFDNAPLWVIVEALI